MEQDVQERFERIERNLELMSERQLGQRIDVDKVLDAADMLVVSGRTSLDSIREMREQQLAQRTDIDKVLDAAGKLIVIGRTCLDSIKEMREQHDAEYKKLLDAQAVTDEKLNILIDTVDRIIRRRNGKE